MISESYLIGLLMTKVTITYLIIPLEKWSSIITAICSLGSAVGAISTGAFVRYIEKLRFYNYHCLVVKIRKEKIDTLS